MTMLIAVSMITETTIDHCKAGDLLRVVYTWNRESIFNMFSLKEDLENNASEAFERGKRKRRETEFSFGSKAQQQQTEWRRDRVLELSSQGFTQSDITTMLQVDKSVISRDLAYLRQQAQKNLQRHIHETIPHEYQKVITAINQVLRMCWSIISKTEDEKTKLQALALINDCNKYKIDLMTNGVVITDAIKYVNGKMGHLNNQEKKLLQDIKDKGEEEVESEDKGLSENSEREEEQQTHNGVF